MRLIDADNLIEAMKKIETEYENEMACPSWWSALVAISEQPTAYDIDKVVEEIEKANQGCCNYCGCDLYSDDVIEIVKQGGVSDDVCEWKYNDTEYYWESSCDHLHIFMSDGPKENEYDFCPYCGKKIKVVE